MAARAGDENGEVPGDRQLQIHERLDEGPVEMKDPLPEVKEPERGDHSHDAENGREAQDEAGTAEILNSLGTVYTGIPQFAPEAARVLTDARRLWLHAGDSDRAADRG